MVVKSMGLEVRQTQDSNPGSPMYSPCDLEQLPFWFEPQFPYL